jgi:Flp pilus assembly protein TadD
MTCRSIHRTPVRPGMRSGARAWSIVIGSCLAVIGLLGGGCVATQRQPATAPGPALPQVPEGATGAAAVSEDRAGSARTSFHETATDRQRFQVHIDFGRVFESQGNLDAAVIEYQDALAVLETTRRGPFQPADESLAHRRIGGAQDRLGQFAQAEVHYKKALKLSPKDPRVWNDAGYSYYLQGRWPDAERALRTAAKLAPDDERIRTNLGLTLAAAGRPDEAFPLLSRSNGDAAGHANLGYLLAATGQFDLARRQYETALALRPDLELARRALARLDRQQVDVQAPGMTPALLAQSAGAPGPRVDAGVNPVSTSRSQIPPPLPWRLLPDSRAPRPVEPQAPRELPPSTLDLSELPPPPPL